MSAMEITDSRRETVAAVLASLLLHLLLILGIALAMTMPAWHFPTPEPEAEEEPIEMTIVSLEQDKPAAPEYVRTTPQNVEKAPEKAPFESDNNTRAASEAAPSGGAAMPSVDGRDAPTLELEDKNYTDGKQTPAAVPQVQTPEQPPVPPEPVATPVPDVPAPAQLALRDAPPRPEKKETQQPPKQAAATQPKPPAASGFQPETRVTRIRGNISNRGKASVDAAATPLGRYKKMVSDAIGSRWYYYVNNQIGLLNIGTVDIRFTVSPDGKVGGVKVVSNTSNESFASVSINSIIEAEIPPIPEEVAKLLDNGRLEIDYSFTILSN